MADNVNIVGKVWKILDMSPFMRMGMRQGLLNTRAVAKYIIHENKIEATLDAVVSAIRRYSPKHYDESFEDAHKAIAHTISISAKSSLVNIALVKDDEIHRLLPQLFSVIQHKQGDVLRIIQADKSIKILIDEKNLEKIRKLFPEIKLLKIDKKLAEINMHMSPDVQVTPGVIAIISNELTINGINIVEIMSCIPELLWFVEEQDIIKAYNVFYELWQSAQKISGDNHVDSSPNLDPILASKSKNDYKKPHKYLSISPSTFENKQDKK